MKICKECKSKHYARGYCRRHYRKYSGEFERRWQKVRSNPVLYAKFRNAEKNWRDKNKDTKEFKEKARLRQKRLYDSNPNRRRYLKEWRLKQSLFIKRAWYKRDNDKVHFDGLREQIIARDEYKCQICKMTREEHYTRYNADLAVHHINHKGRTVLRNERDNRSENLQTLCFSCHRKEDLKYE